MTSQRARPGEISRGARCVPPPPGSRPRFTSGKPSCASRVRDAEVAGERDLEPAAEAVAVDRGDDRHRCLLDQVGDRLDAGGALALGRAADEAGDVRARRERPLALAAQHDRAHVGAELFERVPERVDDRRR